MKTIYATINLKKENIATINAIQDKFPCFITCTGVSGNHMEVSIESRQEDSVAIENMLAKII